MSPPRRGPSGRRRATRAALACLLALLGSDASGGDAPAAAPAPDAEVSPYPGRLPSSEDAPAHAAAVVVDARTGRPVVGALLRGHLEVISRRAPSVAPLLGAAPTDEHGVAWIALGGGPPRDRHWVVTAPGFAPAYEYGFLPPERVALEPAVPNAVRLVDATGRPLAGVPVEVFLGCPHAPALAEGVTDALGVWRLEDGTAEGGNLWARAPGAARRCQSLPVALGDEPETEVLPPGFTAVGRVRDAAGRPLYGATVRGRGYPRGPATLTDREGRFALPGVDPEAGIEVVHPTIEGEEDRHGISALVPDVPLDLLWGVEGFLEPWPTAHLRVRLPAGVEVLRIGPDGRGATDTVPAEGVLSWDLPPGRPRLRPASPFAPLGFDEVVVDLAEGERRDVAPSPRPRARLRVRGGVPERFEATLVVAGRRTELSRTEDGGGFEPVGLPEDRPAVVHVGPWTFPVGPAQGGERVVVVEVPRPHRLRLVGVPGGDDLASPGDVGLSRPGERGPAVLLDPVEGVVELWVGGRLLLHVRGADREAPTLRVPIDLPPLGRGGGDRTVDVAREALPPMAEGHATIHVRRADGQPLGTLRYAGHRWSGEGDSPVDVNVPGEVTIRARGVQPVHLVVEVPGESTHVVPAGGIDVTVTDARGAPAGDRALLDGWLHDVEANGRLRVAGLSAGPHVLIVTRGGGGGVVWRFTLAAGERREKALRLPE